MELKCPKCRRVLPASDLQVAPGTVVCRDCGEFFPLDDVTSERWTVEAVRRYRPDDLPLTETLEGEALLLRLRASRKNAAHTALFAVVWWAFLALWYSMAIPRVGQSQGWFMVLFPLLHVAAGVGVVYGLLGQLFNVTRLRFEGGGLTVVTRPFAHQLAVRAPLEGIDGFGVYDASSRPSSGPPTIDWQVQVMRADGTSTRLKLALPSPAHAQYVADLLNAHLRALREAREPGYRTRG